MPKYYHVKEREKEIYKGEKKSKTLSEKEIKYEGSRVLVAQMQSPTGNYWVLVPGYVQGKGKTKEGVETSEIKLLSKEEKNDLKKKLKEKGFEGEINFW